VNCNVSRSGTSPYGRHLPLPIRRRGASTSMEERHLSNTPHTDRYSTFARQLLFLSKSGQRSTRVVSSRIERFDVLRHSQTQQTNKNKNEPVSAKVRFSPYVPRVRKSPTDGQKRRSKWEEKRGTTPPASKHSRNQERRKSCRKAKTGQKTSKRHYRSSSSDLKTKDTNLGARKKSTPSTDGKTLHHTPRRSPDENLGSIAARDSKLTKSKDKEALFKTFSPRYSQPNKRRFSSRERSSSRDKTSRTSSTFSSPDRSISTLSFSSSDKKKKGLVKSVYKNT